MKGALQKLMVNYVEKSMLLLDYIITLTYKIIVAAIQGNLVTGPCTELVKGMS